MSFGGGYFLDVNKNNIGGLGEITPYSDCSTQQGNNQQGNNQQGNNQQGGAYRYIINPVTNRRVSITGKLGKNILKSYLYQLQNN